MPARPPPVSTNSLKQVVNAPLIACRCWSAGTLLGVAATNWIVAFALPSLIRLQASGVFGLSLNILFLISSAYKPPSYEWLISSVISPYSCGLTFAPGLVKSSVSLGFCAFKLVAVNRNRHKIETGIIFFIVKIYTINGFFTIYKANGGIPVGNYS
jgi:hypothetical protein